MWGPVCVLPWLKRLEQRFGASSHMDLECAAALRPLLEEVTAQECGATDLEMRVARVGGSESAALLPSLSVGGDKR
jgi:hypothetical protein